MRIIQHHGILIRGEFLKCFEKFYGDIMFIDLIGMKVKCQKIWTYKSEVVERYSEYIYRPRNLHVHQEVIELIAVGRRGKISLEKRQFEL